jgi:hypothetical protein
MNGSGFVEDRVLDSDEQLVVTAAEPPGQWLIPGLNHDAFANHIPELLLGYPVFFAVVADYQGRFFYSHK